MLPEGSIHAQGMWKSFRPDVTGSLMGFELKRLSDRIARREIEWVYALKDVSFDIEPGESVGLIGTNGSGKSTLLKLLAGVMQRYAGDLEVSGRIGALIEVRAGIQPLLSGRENILLYGGLLGLSRTHILRQFDRIVEFAELEHAIDRQVKFYSSGMQMRLGFAVAAFLEPAILLVDEVLAVGDADFQQRCLDRIREVVTEGTTVVFVSHDLPSVNAITRRTLWLDQGQILADGPSAEVISEYRVHIENVTVGATKGDTGIEIHDTQIIHPNSDTPRTNEPLSFRMKITSDREIEHVLLFCGISEGTPDPMFVFRRDITPLPPGTHEVVLEIPHLPLPQGHFTFWVTAEELKRSKVAPLIGWQAVNEMTVAGATLEQIPLAVVLRSPVYTEHSWAIDI